MTSQKRVFLLTNETMSHIFCFVYMLAYIFMNMYVPCHHLTFHIAGSTDRFGHWISDKPPTSVVWALQTSALCLFGWKCRSAVNPHHRNLKLQRTIWHCLLVGQEFDCCPDLALGLSGSAMYSPWVCWLVLLWQRYLEGILRGSVLALLVPDGLLVRVFGKPRNHVFKYFFCMCAMQWETGGA